MVINNVDRESYVRELRTWTGTPFQHQGRVKGLDGGVDCIGLLVGAARSLGMPRDYQEINGYGHQPDGRSFAKWCNTFLIKIELTAAPIHEQLNDGDIIVFWVEHPKFPRHVGVYTTIDGKPHVIHSYVQARGVVEMPLTSQYWIPRVYAAFAVPEFMEGGH